MPRNFDLVPVILEVLCVTDDCQRSLMLSNWWYDCHIYVTFPSPWLKSPEKSDI
jgi:hypothetical protein